jgi:hypothetical protein
VDSLLVLVNAREAKKLSARRAAVRIRFHIMDH